MYWPRFPDYGGPNARALTGPDGKLDEFINEVRANEFYAPAALFSPAKMVYVAYVILLFLRTPTPTHGEFFWVSGLFLVVEILHNDWGRIRLNNSGETNRPEWLRPKRD